MMTGRDLLLSALRGERTPRPAWLPFVGTHGASLIGWDAESYLKSSDAIVQGLLKARELYQPDGLPIVFDLQVEAEILGCDLVWAPKGPPSVSSHPLELGGSPADLPPFDTASGRFPIIGEALSRLRSEFGGEVALYGLITGPFTLALHLVGPTIFLTMFDDPDKVHELLRFTADVGRRAAAFYLDNGADVVAVVDPMTSQISPEHFREFVSGPANHVFDAIRERGGLSSLFVCGDATRNLAEMVATRCDSLSIDENIDLAYLRDLARPAGKSIGGNLKLTAVLLLGTPDDARLDAIRCIDACGTDGFVLAPGCDLPFDVPPANLQAVAEMVHDEYRRDVARATLKAPELELGSVRLPDYPNEPDVVVDVITLNSETCAPCQYMVDAVRRAVLQVGQGVRFQEHKIITKEGLSVMAALGVSNLPTICIDGKPEYVSILPDPERLAQVLRERVATKRG
ncbi:MAG: uroporphyrinogen decarboxylase family protein [Fimbriimonadales bacterium]|nr:uroporphyrinogen decarboxylase family protein [Fimbriimonadales bacterium]